MDVGSHKLPTQRRKGIAIFSKTHTVSAVIPKTETSAISSSPSSYSCTLSLAPPSIASSRIETQFAEKAENVDVHPKRVSPFPLSQPTAMEDERRPKEDSEKILQTLQEKPQKSYKSAAGISMARREVEREKGKGGREKETEGKMKGEIRSSEWFVGERKTERGSVKEGRRSQGGERESGERKRKGEGVEGERNEEKEDGVNLSERDGQSLRGAIEKVNDSHSTSHSLSSVSSSSLPLSSSLDDSPASADDAKCSFSRQNLHNDTRDACDTSIFHSTLFPYDHVTFGAPAAFVRRFDAGHNLRHLLKTFSQKGGLCVCVSMCVCV